MQFVLTTILLAGIGDSCFCSGIFESADEIFESVVGDVYQTKKRINDTDMRILMEMEEAFLRGNTDNLTLATPKSVTQTPGPAATTMKPFDPTPEMTMEYRRKVKMKLTIEDIMNSNHTLPDFGKDMGDPSVHTKTFDRMKKQTRRQVDYHVYHLYGPPFLMYPNKIRVLSIMSHFVYATRYKLVHAQVMRKRYLETFQFRIGYCFALLRELKRKQKVIYNVWSFHNRGFKDLLVYLNFYEKIVRLDVDIRDILELIKGLVRGWKLQVDPDYFNHPLKEDR